MKRVALFFMIILLVNFVFAETTFIEGNFDWDEARTILADLPSEVIAAIDEGAEIGSTSTGGYFLLQNYNRSEVCQVCYEDLREKVQEEQKVEYSEEEIVSLTIEVNKRFQTELSNNQIRYIMENFEIECDLPLPLFLGFLRGRFTETEFPTIIIVLILSIIFVTFVIYLIIRFRKHKKRKLRRKKSRKKRKK